MAIVGRIRFSDIAIAGLIVFLFISVYYSYWFQSEYQLLPPPRIRQTTERHTKPNSCDVINIGILCDTHESKLKMYTMLKSLFRYRKSNPIKFYMIIHPDFESSLRKLFATWALPDVEVKMMHSIDYIDPDREFKDSPNMLRFMLPEKLELTKLSKIILLSTDIILKSDIFELWNEFQYFREKQFLGVQYDKYMEGNERRFAEIVLYHLDNLKKYGWRETWKMIEEKHQFKYYKDAQIRLIFNNFVKSKYIYSLECSWNTIINTNTECISQTKVVHQEAVDKENFVDIMKRYDGNAVRKLEYNCFALPKQKKVERLIKDTCSSFPESEIQQKRTLLDFFESSYEKRPYFDDRVTLATQLTFHQFHLLEDMAVRWKGPMSITFYLTDDELIKCIDLIRSSNYLKHRINTGYHVVFKYGRYFHSSYLRNVAIREVKTPYVFSTDIFEMPMENLYTVLKNQLSDWPNMTNTALVVPTFESINERAYIPRTKQQVLAMLQQKKVFIPQEQNKPKAHAPTDYTKWKVSKIPYKVTWQNLYEPFVVVKKYVATYDERFFAYGGDHESYIMELEAQSYEFYVLPNTFVIHELPRKSEDKNLQLYSKKYKMCRASIQRMVAQDLKDKFGRTIHHNDLIKTEM